MQAFELLREYLNINPKNGRKVVFIVCGSATSWMINNFNQNKGGLFNRQTCRLYLKPFTLREVEAFLEHRNIYWSWYEIAETYMIMGGIPFYLNLIRGSLSFSQNIDNLFFRKNGELHDEFDHLYQTLFSNSENYIRIVQALSEKPGGLTRYELAEKAGLSTNGNLTEIINNLIASGFVRVSSFYRKKKKDALYQLSDYYTAFYFRYIKDHYGRDEHYWSNAIDDPARRAWAQIDLVMERRDRVINLCEMKFSINEFVIDKAYDAVLRNKLDAFRRVTGTRSSLQITMITTYGVKKNKYSNLIQSQITLDDLFYT